MRRRRAKSVQPSVSLFPFLAVLICTLGVLIVLLVLAVKTASIRKKNDQQTVAKMESEAKAEAAEMARAAAEADAKRVQKKQRQQEVIAELEDEIDLRILQAEGFEADRPRLRREVAKARDHRAHLEKEIAKIESQAQQLVNEMKLLDSDLRLAQADVDDSEIEKLKEQIASAEQQLAQKRSDVEVIEQKKYAIVPYHGSGGTKRVPVFVECNRDGITLQPWGIELTGRDFFHPVAAGNPVDAALSAVRNYYAEHELTQNDQRPYPLIVVRPDGAPSYGLARQSLVSWDDEFGYELVSQDKELDFGTVDPQLQQEVQSAVKKAKLTQLALKQRRAMMAGARRGGYGQRFSDGTGNRSEGSMRSSSQHGGFVRDESRRQSRTTNRQASYLSAQSQSRQSTQHSNGESKTGDVHRTDVAKIAASERSNFGADSDQRTGSASNAQASFANVSKQSSAGPNANGMASPMASMANSRGANWALPTQTSGATGYVRPVTVVCSADSLTIRNVAGETITIPIAEQPTQAIDKMVNIIWQRIDAWGIAGASAYWKPNLSIVVRPGAAHRFAMLKQLLRGSGLGVEEATR